MKSEVLTEIANLMSTSEKLSGWHEAYEEHTAKPDVDKFRKGFNTDSRFPVFSVKGNIQFDACSGIYGHSSASTFRRLHHHDLIERYFIRALNVLQEELFRTMADLMREDAKEKAASAQSEIDRLQDVVSRALSGECVEADQ